MTTRIAYAIRHEDYDTFKALVADKAWPETFDQWQQGASQETDKLLARGDIVQRAIIDPQAFTAYCRAAGVDHNHASLGAFAVKVAREQSEGR